LILALISREGEASSFLSFAAVLVFFMVVVAFFVVVVARYSASRLTHPTRCA
jgi:heme/copper-type cytochrome/quinol oxidase subunit 2